AGRGGGGRDGARCGERAGPRPTLTRRAAFAFQAWRGGQKGEGRSSAGGSERASPEGVRPPPARLGPRVRRLGDLLGHAALLPDDEVAATPRDHGLDPRDLVPRDDDEQRGVATDPLVLGERHGEL